MPIPVLALFLLFADALPAETTLAVLDFELNDLTLQPRTPEELERTGSIRPMLEQALAITSDVRLIDIDPTLIDQANAGFGYLFDHPRVAARLGVEHGADWILVGRLHKPSFLFVYLVARLVSTRNGVVAEDYVVELKGQQDLVTGKGVERLAENIRIRLDKKPIQR